MGILDNLEASMENADLPQNKETQTVENTVEMSQGFLPCPYCGGDGVLWVPSHNDPNQPEQEQCFSCDSNGMVEVSKTIESIDPTWMNEPY